MFPRMIEVKQHIPSPELEDYVAVIKDELKKKNLSQKIKPGSKIAITAGSRGIAHYAEILTTIVQEVKQAGGTPFLVAAMGSHGGATPKGQLQVLQSLGITSDTVGAPIYSSMEVDEVGRLENGAAVYVDRTALKADGIIVVGRVKPHTDFKGLIESGLLKMLAIGLGKQKGAEMIHWYKTEGYHKLISAAAKLIIKKAPILLGLAIVENAKHKIALVKALNPEEFEREEMKLLKKAKHLLARLPLKEIDVLIVDEIGKNFSGVGMDTNVIGRFWIPGESDPRTPKINRIVVLGLSDETHGNAIGIGLADLTTRRVISNIDYDSTFVNCLTTGFTDQAKIPIFLPNDRDAIS
ncbi:MAG: DUF2088 domain-containing protein, partial [Candidatus Bathyarchaeota archaeon]